MSQPTIHMCRQYSDEWWKLRRGIPTASNFGRILTAKTAKPSAQQGEYIAELIADRRGLAAPPEDRPTSPAMAAGLSMEPEARRWYAMRTNEDVRQVGFAVSACGRFGCSPDGLIGADGGLELKCPLGKTHVRYLNAGDLPAEYRCQVHGSLIVTGRAYWDFLSYAPGLPPFLFRVVPDDFTTILRAALDEFHAKYLDTLQRIEAM